jgi:hypothetical protein
VRVPDEPYTIIPHEDVEKVESCGCVVVVERGDQADLICNECSALIRTVPLERAATTLAEMESTEICSARCMRCGALHALWSAEYLSGILGNRSVRLLGVR